MARNRDKQLMHQLEQRLSEPVSTVRQTVLAVSRIPYGRQQVPTPVGVIREWRGTCSSKHLLLAALIRERWPDVNPVIWHRVYTVTPELAMERWGPSVAASVPPGGLVDVHTYAVLSCQGRDVRVDVTFPLADWDGGSDIALACGDGYDVAGGADPLAVKTELVAANCDVNIREPFIAALGEADEG